MRVLATVWILATALAALSCKPSQQNLADADSTYGTDRCAPPALKLSKQGQEYGELMSSNHLQIGPSGLKWNGSSISAGTLQQYLRMADQMNPPINLQIVIDPSTRCVEVNQTRDLIRQNFPCAPGSIPVCVEYTEAEYQAESSRHFVY